MAVEPSAPPVILCDSIRTLAVHNGVARIVFARLSATGTAAPALELLVPVPVIAQFVETLKLVERS